MPEAIWNNNYLLATQQEVSHDNSLSGNGTVNSPLGANDNNWYNVTSAVSYNSGLVNAGSWQIYYNPFLKEVNLIGDLQYKATEGYVMTWPSYLKPAITEQFSIGVGLSTYVNSTGLWHSAPTANWCGGAFVWGVQ